MFLLFAKFIAGFVIGLGASAAVATVVGIAVAAVTFVGVSMLAAKLLAPKMPVYADLDGRGTMTRNAIAARQIVYGQCKVSGPIVFMSESGTKNEFLHIVVCVAGHQVEEIGDVYFNEDLVLSGAGDGAGSGVFSSCNIYKHLGTTTQTVDTVLSAALPALWDSTHRLQGIAYIYVRLRYSAEVFPGGIPNISAIVKGKLVYDPATTLTAYSSNPALCLRDYLTDSDLGMGMTSAEIDDAAVTTAATACDVLVDHLPSGQEKRYECNGQTVTSATPDAIIGQLLSSMAGNVAYSGGQIVMYAGTYRTPTVTLNESHLAGAFSVATRSSARDRVNAVKGTFISASNQWAAADFPSIYSSTYTTEDNGVAHWRDVVLPFTTSSNAAQRIAIINLRQARQEITFSAKFNLNAMQLKAGDTVQITNAKLGWTAKVFEVIEWSLSTDGEPPVPTIAMTLRETDSTVYAWSVGDEIAVVAAANTDLPDPFTVAAPTGLTLLSDETTAFYQPDGTYIPRIQATWTAPSDEFVQSGGKVQVQYKQAAAATLIDWTVVPGDTTLEYITDVKSGTLYTIALYSINFFGVTGSVVTANVTASTNNVAPAAVASLSAVTGTGKAVSLDWPDSTERDLGEYEVQRSPASAGTWTTLAEVRASRFVDVDVTIGTAYDYRVRAFDRTENAGGFSPTATATPGTVSAGAVDNTAPNNPSAPTLSSSTTYLSGDGTVFSKIVMNVPIVPTGGYLINLLYRKSGATGWLIADQRSSGGGTTDIDDLTPGNSYEVAAQAFSAFGVGSGIVTATGSPFTAPNKTTGPAAPSGVAYVAGNSTSFNRPAQLSGANRLFSFRANWTAPADLDTSYYEWALTAVDTDAAADAASKTIVTIAEAIVSNGLPISSYFRVRAVNNTGIAGSWGGGGTNINGSGLWGVAGGSMMSQDATAVAISGGSVSGITDIAIADGGTGASDKTTARTNLGVRRVSHVEVLAGGAATESFTFNHGFGVLQEYITIQCVSPAGDVDVVHDFGAGGNDANNSVFLCLDPAGGTIAAGARRFTIHFLD
jgi:hypothetical protein